MTELLRPAIRSNSNISEAERKLQESLYVDNFLRDYYSLSGESQKEVLRKLLGKEVSRLHLQTQNREHNIYEGYPEYIGFGDMSPKAFSCLGRFKKIFSIVSNTVDSRYFLDNGCESRIYQEFSTYSDQNLVGVEWELPVLNSLTSLLPRVRMWDKNDMPVLDFQRTYAEDLDQLIYDLVDIDQHSSISMIVNETIGKNNLSQRDINKGLELVPMELKRWREIRLGGELPVKPNNKELCYLAIICQDLEGLLPHGIWATRLASSKIR